MDLVNPEKLFFIGNRNFEFYGEIYSYEKIWREEQICICDNAIFGLSTGINIVDLVNPEKLFFIGNRNFEFYGDLYNGIH